MNNERLIRAILALRHRPAAAAVAMVLAAFPAGAVADPGEPDQEAAAAGVYVTGEPGDVLGTAPEGAPEGGEDSGRDPAAPIVAGDEPGSQGTPATIQPVSEEAAGVTSIPFTGYAALVVIGAGFALLIAGAILRLIGRTPRSAR